MFVGTAEPKESVGWLGFFNGLFGNLVMVPEEFSNDFTQTQGQSLY